MKTVEVKGMSCQHCVASVEKALGALDGITEVKADLEKGVVTFEEAGPVEADLIKDTIDKIGFEVGEVN